MKKQETIYYLIDPDGDIHTASNVNDAETILFDLLDAGNWNSGEFTIIKGIRLKVKPRTDIEIIDEADETNP